MSAVDFSRYRQGGDAPPDEDLAGTKAPAEEPWWPGMNAGGYVPRESGMVGCRPEVISRGGEAVGATGCWHAWGDPCDCGCHWVGLA